MAVSAEKIEDNVLQDLVAQRDARKQPSPEVTEDLEHQRRLREGDYDVTTIPGMAQTGLGVVENLAQMITGFAAAVPGAFAGLAMARSVPGGDAASAYSKGFELGASPDRFYTYEPKSIKGKRYQDEIADAYNEYIEEKWGNEYLGGLVDEGRITPAEATFYRASADALLMGVFMRAGVYAKNIGHAAGRAAGKVSRKPINLDAAPLEGEIIPFRGEGYRPGTGQRTSFPETKLLEGPKKLLPKKTPVGIAVKQALERGVPIDEITTAVESAKAPEVVVQKVTTLEPEQIRPAIEKGAPETFTDPKNIFKNRQAGAVDPEVFIEVFEKLARPGVVSAKVLADLSHALARQVAFKHVTDIRKINSPTAKMLADRIMPLEDSKIPLGGGFHELISISEGKFNQRIENLLEPLRKHVINKNAAKTLRLIALPKRVNNDIFRALDTGIAPEYLVPTVRAVRAILDELLAYQNEAGTEIARRPNYMKHMWDHKKISRVEFGKKKGGPFTKYLMEEEGLSFDAAQEVIATITKEEGFLDFVEDTGGRLQRGENYSAWAGRTRGIAGGASRPGHVQQRVLKGEFDKAKEWLVTDVEAVLTNYVSRAVRHAEYTRIAGKNERILNQTVRQIIEEQDIGGQRGGKLRANSPHQTAQEIYDMFDAMQGRFHQIKTPSVRRASKAVAGFQVVQKLSLVALAQFPETMMPAARYRVATATKALPGVPIPLKSYAVGMVDSAINAMSHASLALVGKRVIPKTEIRNHLERIGVIYSSALQSSASRIAGPTGVITNRAIRLFGMEAITNLQRSIALDTINSMVRENARYLAKGKEGKKAKMYRQELVELGIKPEEAVAWYQEGMPKDHPIHKRLDIAHVRGVDTTIIMPKAANAPRLYNDQRFQLPLIFTRFFTVFGNTVLKSIGNKLASRDVTNTRKLASIGSLVAAVGIAYYTQFLREDISGYQYREEDDPLRVVDAVDRAGLTAMFTRLYPLFSAYKYGQGSQIVANLLGGPFAGDVAGFIEATKGSNEQRARYLAKMTPIMTVTPASEDLMYEFYLELIDGLPERR